jgi:hypothetical protein
MRKLTEKDMRKLTEKDTRVLTEKEINHVSGGAIYQKYGPPVPSNCGHD